MPVPVPLPVPVACHCCRCRSRTPPAPPFPVLLPAAAGCPRQKGSRWLPREGRAQGDGELLQDWREERATHGHAQARASRGESRSALRQDGIGRFSAADQETASGASKGGRGGRRRNDGVDAGGLTTNLNAAFKVEAGVGGGWGGSLSFSAPRFLFALYAKSRQRGGMMCTLRPLALASPESPRSRGGATPAALSVAPAAGRQTDGSRRRRPCARRFQAQPTPSLSAQLLEAGLETLTREGRSPPLSSASSPPFPLAPSGPPGDAAPALVGDALGFLDGVARRARDQQAECLRVTLAGTPVTLAVHPAAARNVLEGSAPSGRLALFRKEGTAFFPGSSLAGRGLLVTDGAEWARQRRCAAPALRPTAVSDLSPSFVSAARSFLGRAWRRPGTRDCLPDLNALSLDIVSRSLFGADLVAVGFPAVLARAFAAFSARSGSVLAMAVPETAPTPDALAFRAAVRDLDRFVYACIDARRARVLRGEDPGTDLLGRLVASTAAVAAEEEGRGGGGGEGGVNRQQASRGKGVGNERAREDVLLRDELMTMAVAGQETSALALSWTLHFLSLDPAWQSRCRAEARAAGDCTELGALPSVQAALLEAMRLRPPAHLVGRCCWPEDTEVAGTAIGTPKGRVWVPRGENVLGSSICPSHHPSIDPFIPLPLHPVITPSLHLAIHPSIPPSSRPIKARLSSYPLTSSIEIRADGAPTRTIGVPHGGCPPSRRPKDLPYASALWHLRATGQPRRAESYAPAEPPLRPLARPSPLRCRARRDSTFRSGGGHATASALASP